MIGTGRIKLVWIWLNEWIRVGYFFRWVFWKKLFKMFTFLKKVNLNFFKIKVMFCNPPGAQSGSESAAQPIRFYFTDQARISNTTGGEHYVSQMLGSLYDSIEADYGVLATRLYRAFRPTARKSKNFNT